MIHILSFHISKGAAAEGLAVIRKRSHTWKHLVIFLVYWIPVFAFVYGYGHFSSFFVNFLHSLIKVAHTVDFVHFGQQVWFIFLTCSSRAVHIRWLIWAEEVTVGLAQTAKSPKCVFFFPSSFCNKFSHSRHTKHIYICHLKNKTSLQKHQIFKYGKNLSTLNW